MIAAFTALHYGSDYLYYAIRSVAPFVDIWCVAYSPVGSHGHKTVVSWPDHEEDLKQQAVSAILDCGKPVRLRWWNGEWANEGAQRDSVYRHAEDADLILVVDSDEVWHPESVAFAIERGLEQTNREGRIPMRHFWRSFGWCCRDQAAPARVIRPRLPNGVWYPNLPKPVEHFGYARKPVAIAYKMLTHGHKAEWRPDWFSYKFLRWTPEAGPFADLHPTNRDFWTAEPFDRAELPTLMHSHPYYGLEMIA